MTALETALLIDLGAELGLDCEQSAESILRRALQAIREKRDELEHAGAHEHILMERVRDLEQQREVLRRDIAEHDEVIAQIRDRVDRVLAQTASPPRRAH